MHDNSLKAYREELNKLSHREQEIYYFLLANSDRSYTDREIQVALKYRNRSDVQPRCSDLLRKKLIKEVGKEKCETTTKTVRKLTVAGDMKQSELWEK